MYTKGDIVIWTFSFAEPFGVHENKFVNETKFETEYY